ncbi:squalene--hopene cyclase [Phormidesmis priestleyi ULC007]|uniref:Squalene--hopene cyclase n=1 Tax=Phormidesmis priestleyi ULC007 TaxID=1920490 RepID=A0A2T1DK11_9CYAN|nr:squalene--hopene cyclase [Phormidesmis priestleyi ULC007]PZO51768.1 MAG: squalene--hopene cyclase [Phormidesmis priestleyi]
MQERNRVTNSQLDGAIAASQNYLLSTQNPEGYWWAELESNVTMTAEVVLLHKIWGTDQTRPMYKAEKFLRSQQRDHGGWELFYGDGGELSVTVETYMALKLLGVAINDPTMVKAREFILARGGVAKTRVFTKFHLALIGCYPWSGLPSIPPGLMLLPSLKLEIPNPFGSEPLFSASTFSIYELSSWARGSTVPLMIVFDRKPVFLVDRPITLDELYADGITNTNFDLPRKSDWTDLFVDLDKVFKVAENWNLMPFREAGLKAAEQWILERQEASGDWGGIIPAMLNSLLALRCLDYDAADPVVERGLNAVDRFSNQTDHTFSVQPCVSPVWDTALVMRSLVDSGMTPNHPALVRGGEWLLEKQILDYGDWAVKNQRGKPGAWAFEFENRFYPDVDDSAVVVMALAAVDLPNERLKNQAIVRAVNWIITMQCKPGGWAAFDLDNDQDWLNAHPYGDLKAMIDPNTADVTARVLEMFGRLPDPHLDANRLDRALTYLRQEQESDGSWFGRWGVNYIYGTSGVLAALSLVAPTHKSSLDRGAAWLVKRQNPDGGWGETCASYQDSSLKGKGNSTASQTAWALIGLLAAGETTHQFAWNAIDHGITYLLTTQRENGTWNEDHFTGTGFPGHFYLKYHLYQQHFPLTALGRYREINQNFLKSQPDSALK